MILYNWIDFNRTQILNICELSHNFTTVARSTDWVFHLRSLFFYTCCCCFSKLCEDVGTHTPAKADTSQESSQLDTLLYNAIMIVWRHHDGKTANKKSEIFYGVLRSLVEVRWKTVFDCIFETYIDLFYDLIHSINNFNYGCKIYLMNIV